MNEEDGLPAGWTLKTVGELAACEPNSITDGPFGSKLKTAHYTRTGPRVIRLTNIGDGEFVDAHAHISDDHFATLTKHRVHSGDIVIAALGEKLPRSCLIPASVGPAIVKADCIRFKPSEEHSAQFLNYALNWEGTQKRTAAIVHGVGRPRLNLSEVKSILLPVPPLKEQHRIVAEIEKQFTRLNAGVSALRRVEAKLKRYRAGILKAACEGRLVPTEAELLSHGDRDDQVETGDALLGRISAMRREQWSARVKYREPVAPDAANLNPLPEGWSVGSIDQLSSHLTSGSRDWSQFYDRGAGTFVLAQNIRPMRLDLSTRQSVDAPAGDAETERTRVRRNDVLVTIVGANTGDVCSVPTDLEDHFVCQSVALIRPVLPDCAKFMELYLASEENGQAQWKRFIYGQGRPHLSFDQLRATAIPVPPVAEQKRIVAEVERRFSVVEELEAVVTANLQRATRLRQSILQRAFAGQLV